MTAKYLWQWTHADLDGVGCAVVAAHLFPKHERDVRYCYHKGSHVIDTEVVSFLDSIGEDGKGLPEGEHEILITDIAPNPEICERLNNLNGVFRRLAIFDHHKSTLETSKKYLWFLHSENQACATRMLYELSVSTHVPRLNDFVYAVDAWDRWVLNSKHRKRGERLNRLYRMLGFKAFLKYFQSCPDADISTWLKELAGILESRLESSVNETVARQNVQRRADAQGRNYVVLIGNPEYTSELGHAILEEFPDVAYAVMVLPGINIVSMRAREGGVDVEEIAKRFGGGGHKGAAGFSPEDSFNMLIVDHLEALLDG